MTTGHRQSFSTPQVLGLVVGIGLSAISVGAVVLLSIRVPPAASARPAESIEPPFAAAPVAPPADRPKPVEAKKPAPAVPQPEPVRAGKLQPERDPKPSRYKVGAAVEQEVTFTRRSIYRIQGIDVAQAAEYAFVSDVVVDARKPDGGCVMKQTIRSTRLVQCDPDFRMELQAALDKTHGTTFEIGVGPDGDVRELRGPKDAVRVQAQNDLTKTASFRVWSLLDEAAWKELAGITLMQPPTLKTGETWSKPLRHDWGPLGSWDGRTTFKVNGKQLGRDRIDYTHALWYTPAAAGAGADLPLRIVRAEFRSPTAHGSVLYDAAKGRVAKAEESFLVRGRVVASALGTEVAVDVEERQDFQVTVREPTERSLEGRPKK